MNRTTVVSILGCGWFGFPLAVRLSEKGFFVRGSTTSPDKLNALAEKKIDPFLVQLSPKLNSSKNDKFFQTDVIIINIPPKGNPDGFLEQMRELLKQILKHQIKKVIFISSTAVYGEVNAEVDEETVPKPETASGKALLTTEKLFLTNQAFQASIIRFGGLVGPGRHPGKFFSGKKDIPNGRAPVNLIHLEDCIGITEAVLERDAWNKIFNACSPHHPSRQEFYTAAAAAAGLPLPQFKDELLQWKIVNSKNLGALNK